MKFLDAKKIIKEQQGTRLLKLHLLASPQLENLSPYLEAQGVLAGYNLAVHHSQFGTLEQELVSAQSAPFDAETLRTCVLFPWDFCRHLDWRSDASENSHDVETLLNDVNSFLGLFAQFNQPTFFVDAPVPPICKDHTQQTALTNHIRSQALTNNMQVVDASLFNLDAYIELGMAIHNSAAPTFAKQLVDSIPVFFRRLQAPKKVIITDLDNVAWRGVIGEDGIDGIHCALQSKGKNQYLYQKYLKSQIGKGIILAAVSKNDLDLAQLPFKTLGLPLTVDDFVAFKVSYGLKSNHIRELSQELNLPLDSFVFVDDNPVEIGEVSGELPQVTCIQFPLDAQPFPAFLHHLNSYFSFGTATEEDARRGELYKIRQQAIAESQSAHSLEDFLANLAMRMVIYDRTHNQVERALQLINKTNQFNLNGRRISETELATHFAEGAKLYSASLADKYGDHGEILACLVTANGDIVAWVMSCRVFQRRVEHCFLAWLLQQSDTPLRLAFEKTERNSPTEVFLTSLDIALQASPALTVIDRDAVAPRLNNPAQFFTLTEEHA